MTQMKSQVIKSGIIMIKRTILILDLQFEAFLFASCMYWWNVTLNNVATIPGTNKDLGGTINGIVTLKKKWSE